MPALSKYPAEVRDRAVRMVNEKLINEPALAVSTAWRLFGEQVGINKNTLGNWVKQHHVDSGKAALHNRGCSRGLNPPVSRRLRAM